MVNVAKCKNLTLTFDKKMRWEEGCERTELSQTGKPAGVVMHVHTDLQIGVGLQEERKQVLSVWPWHEQGLIGLCDAKRQRVQQQQHVN